MAPRGRTTETISVYGIPVLVVPRNGLKGALDARLNVTTVWLSIGGDDLLEGLPFTSLHPDAIIAEMVSKTSSILEAAFAAHPHVNIRAANPRGPGGPTGPLGTPFRTPGALSGLTKTR